MVLGQGTGIPLAAGLRLVLRLQFVLERPGEAWVPREGEGCRMQSGSVEDTAVSVFRDPPRRGGNVFFFTREHPLECISLSCLPDDQCRGYLVDLS